MPPWLLATFWYSQQNTNGCLSQICRGSHNLHNLPFSWKHKCIGYWMSFSRLHYLFRHNWEKLPPIILPEQQHVVFPGRCKMKGFRCQIGPFSQTRSMDFFIVQSFNYWHCSKILFVSLITWSLHVAIRAWHVLAAKVQFSLLCHTRHCALWVYTVHCVLHCALCSTV